MPPTAHNTWIDVGADIASALSDWLAGSSSSGSLAEFTPTQLQLLQDLFQAGITGMAKVVAERLGSLESRLMKLEGDHLDQRAAATSEMEAANAGSAKTRSRRARRMKTKRKYQTDRQLGLTHMEKTSNEHNDPEDEFGKVYLSHMVADLILTHRLAYFESTDLLEYGCTSSSAAALLYNPSRQFRKYRAEQECLTGQH